MNNNYFVSGKKTGVLLLACLLLVCAYYIIQHDKKRFDDKNFKNLYKIDSIIKKTDFIEDSIRTNWEPFIAQTLNKNDNYMYVHNHKNMVDSITNANEDILDRAYKIVRSEAVYNVPRRTPKLFTDYKYMPAIRNLSGHYYTNKKKIREFEECKQIADNFESRTRNYCDSIVITQLKQLQRQKDSLLRKKQEMIYMCQK